MIKKLIKPQFSKRENLIIKECCTKMIKSMEKHDTEVGLDDIGKAIKEDIYEILKKLN